MLLIVLTDFKPPSFLIISVVLIHTSILLLLLSFPSSEHHILVPSKHHSHPASSPDLTVVSQKASLTFFSYMFTTQKGATLYMRKLQNYVNFILPFNHRVSPESATLACISKGVECEQKMEGLDGVRCFWWQKSLGYSKLMSCLF